MSFVVENHQYELIKKLRKIDNEGEMQRLVSDLYQRIPYSSNLKINIEKIGKLLHLIEVEVCSLRFNFRHLKESECPKKGLQEAISSLDQDLDIWKSRRFQVGN